MRSVNYTISEQAFRFRNKRFDHVTSFVYNITSVCLKGFELASYHNAIFILLYFRIAYLKKRKQVPYRITSLSAVCLPVITHFLNHAWVNKVKINTNTTIPWCCQTKQTSMSRSPNFMTCILINLVSCRR